MKLKNLLILAAIIVSILAVYGCAGDENVTYHVDDGGQTNNPTPTPTPAPNPDDDDDDDDDDNYEGMTGEELYNAVCVTCHPAGDLKIIPLPTKTDTELASTQTHHADAMGVALTLEQFILIRDWKAGGGSSDPEPQPEPDPETEDPVELGKAVFNSNCFGCHNGGMAPAVTDSLFDGFTAATLDDAKSSEPSYHGHISITGDDLDNLVQFINAN